MRVLPSASLGTMFVVLLHAQHTLSDLFIIGHINGLAALTVLKPKLPAEPILKYKEGLKRGRRQPEYEPDGGARSGGVQVGEVPGGVQLFQELAALDPDQRLHDAQLWGLALLRASQ